MDYVLGSSGLTVMDVEVFNGGEDAFDAFAHLTWSPSDAFSFIKVSSSIVDAGDGKGSSVVVSCSSLSSSVGDETTTGVDNGGGSDGVACQLGNSLTLPALRSASFSVHLKPTLKQQNKAESISATAVQFSLKLSSSNPDEAGHEADNQANLSLAVRVKTHLYVAG